MHSILPFLLAMVVAIVLLHLWATRLKVAYPIVLVVAGLLISFVPGLPQVRIDPEMIFFIFLPPLLFEASWTISYKEMRKWWRIIGSFAFLVVFLTALSVALVAERFIPGFTLALGFLLGGIVSPPDAVSTGAITKFVRIPRSFAAILEGESLLNDASSLIIFRFALVAVGTGHFIWQQAAMSFFWMVIGGVGIGLGLAWLFMQAHKKLPMAASSDVAFTVIEPYCMYWAAEQLHCSGVLAVVAGGLFMSTRRMVFLNGTSRMKGFSVWESFVFILNGIVFLLIGLEMPEVVAGLRADGIPLGTAIGYGVLVTGVLIAVRILSAFGALLATLVFRPGVAPRNRSGMQMIQPPLVLGWAGMRGVVSLAAALAIPLTLEGGQPFPERNLILFITFTAILLTLVLQGLTLPYLINHWRVFDGMATGDTEKETLKRMKHGLREHVYQFLKEKYGNEGLGNAGIQRLLHEWEERSKATDDSWMNEHTRTIFTEMLDSQREYLLELNKDPQIEEEIIRQQLYRIDLEEERLKIAGELE